MSLDLNQTWEQILAMEDVDKRLAALDKLYRVQQAERDWQMLDVSRSVLEASQTQNISRAVMHIPEYDGTNMNLKEFIQDVDNGFTLLPAEQEPQFLRFVISRLKSKARQSLEGNTFQTLADLKNHLRDCFAPSRSYGYYLNEIQAASMRKGENVRQYYGRLNALINNAVSAVKEGLTEAQAAVDQKPHLELLAL